MRWRILADGVAGPYPLGDWYAHPWEAELVMRQHMFTGWVQGFRDGAQRTFARDWLRVDL